LVPELGAKLDEVLKKGLSREPARRYQTAREMALDIEACVPAIRPSEVGAWVTRIAGDALAARASVLAEIERSEHGGAPAGERTGPTSQPIAVANGGPEILNTRAGRHGQEATPHSARTIDPDNGTMIRAVRSRKRIVVFGVLLSVLAISGAAAVAARPHPPRVSPEATGKAAPQPAASVPEPPPIVAIAPSAGPVIPSISFSALPEASAKPAPSIAPPVPRAQSRATAPTRSSHPKRNACDPPYSIDSEGRQIFKPECM
jgi:hypothetical protein